MATEFAKTIPLGRLAAVHELRPTSSPRSSRPPRPATSTGRSSTSTADAPRSERRRDDPRHDSRPRSATKPPGCSLTILLARSPDKVAVLPAPNLRGGVRVGGVAGCSAMRPRRRRDRCRRGAPAGGGGHSGRPHPASGIRRVVLSSGRPPSGRSLWRRSTRRPCRRRTIAWPRTLSWGLDVCRTFGSRGALACCQPEGECDPGRTMHPQRQ